MLTCSLSGLSDVFLPCCCVQNVSSLSPEWVLPGPILGGGRTHTGEANVRYLLGEILCLWVLSGHFPQGYHRVTRKGR